jgi:glycosyltransferase involved in cell wall biosynthesis
VSGASGERGTVALLPWGNVIEDFLDPIGLSLDDFCARLTGGWLFGYIDALRFAGWRTVIFLISRQAEAPARLAHLPSGTPICVLPTWKLYRGRRSRPDAAIDRTGNSAGRKSALRRLRQRILGQFAPYFATPLVAVARGLRSEGCTAILTQEYEYARFDMCVVLGRLLGLPVYATFQGGSRHARGLEDVVRPFAVRAARGLVIGPEGEARRVIGRYRVKSEKVWRIYNPVDLDLWQPMDRDEARQALGLPRHTRLIVYHGRIDMHRKGLDMLLQAWEQICGDYAAADVRLLMIGSGQDDAVLREQLQRPELRGIQWIDRYELDRSVMRRYLCAANISVLPSRLEGFPVAPLEAMACGLPVIGTDIPAMANILDRGCASGGIMIRQDDDRALAQAFRMLLNDPDLCRELGRKARRNVEERFSIESVGRQFDQMLTARPQHD